VTSRYAWSSFSRSAIVLWRLGASDAARAALGASFGDLVEVDPIGDHPSLGVLVV
jgi:hypothetical protein